MTEHAVLVNIRQGPIALEALHDLETKPIAVLEDTDVGELDGHDVAIGLSDATLYLYGPDADALFSAIAPTLQAEPLTRGATALLRYGEAEDETAREVTVTIGQGAT